MSSNSTDIYDLIILGGGISGLGLAWLATQQGYKVLLLEKKTNLCSGASNNTLRIMHGGFRYLQNLDFPRLLESLRDQQYMFQNFEAIVEEFSCLMPLNNSGMKSYYPVLFASKFYNLLSALLIGEGKKANILNKNEAQEFSGINSLFDRGALTWKDGRLFSNANLAKHLLKNSRGLRVVNNIIVESVSREKQNYKVVCSATEQEIFYGKTVVNALGFEINSIQKPCDNLFNNIQWARSFNIVLSKALPKPVGIGVQSNEGRLFFLVPRTGQNVNDHSALGTFNQFWPDLSAKLEVSDDDISLALHAFNAALPEFVVSSADVSGIEVGLLPIKKVKSNGEPVFFGQEKIAACDGYIEILSTKYTTFRSQSHKVLKLINKYLQS